MDTVIKEDHFIICDNPLSQGSRTEFGPYSSVERAENVIRQIEEVSCTCQGPHRVESRPKKRGRY